MGVSDIIAASTEPVNKLLDAVTGAIGKAYEARHIRKMADAKAYEIKTICEEVRNNSDIPIVYSGTGVEVDTSNYEELARRAGSRLAYQEIAKQENIEAVVDCAYQELLGKSSTNGENVSRDWMTRFINSVEDISSENMQKLWGKILAGEILEPSTFSYKTLECMRNLSKKDAELFERLCKIVIEDSFIISDLNILKNWGFTYNDILSMDECGLINSSGIIRRGKKISHQNFIIIDFGEYLLMGKAKEAESIDELAIEHFSLTKAGREISSIIEAECPFDYIKEVSENIKNTNTHCVVTLHKINKKYEDNIEFEEKDLLTGKE